MTMNNLPGYHIRAILGEVVGVTARPQNKFTEGVRSLDGNLSDSGEQALVAGRREAVERMAFHARTQGANAILAMHFDHRVINSAWIEICAYGTAVVAVPIRRAPRQRRELPAAPNQTLYETNVTTEALA
ncbi:MAG TPA: heavy metal-binding domain-containing protein [Pseudonocardiaceae bacterium]|nr:heavy metal-binding domain-containing protein [Pseudonocardiaceae bacterium]